MAKKPALPELVALGPQSDGSIVLRLPDDFHLMLTRKAVEKNRKNSDAASGTLSALADGDDPWLDKVKTAQDRILSILNKARAPNDQIADTPIGRELAAATAAAVAGDTPEPIDGSPGDVWAPHVPKPRPKVGDRIVSPDGSSRGVKSNRGWDVKDESFVVVVLGTENTANVVAHVPQADDLGPTAAEVPYVWRIRSGLYGTATTPPAVAPAADLTADAPGAYADDDEPPEPNEPPAPGKPARKRATRDVSPKKADEQRARNARTSGLTPPPKKRGRGTEQ